MMSPPEGGFHETRHHSRRCARRRLHAPRRHSGDRDWSQHGQAGSQTNLNTGLIDGTAVSIPVTVEEQRGIAAMLSDIDAEIAALEAKLTKARQIKQGMMQELLTGRIRLV